MLSKPRRDRLQISNEAWRTGRNSPHLLYANLDFGAPGVPRGARPLLRWLDLVGPEWDENRTLLFLWQHQVKFRMCLDWLTKNSAVDFRRQFDNADEYTESEFQKKWEQQAEVRFLQTHGLGHSGVKLEPKFQDGPYLEGLQLSQRRARDPLDPICWYLLSLLASHGTVYVRRCGYWKCGKFLWPRTARKLFCSDSCRALTHVAKMDLEKVGEQSSETKRDQFRKRRREYMKEYRALPIVKRRPAKYKNPVMSSPSA